MHWLRPRVVDDFGLFRAISGAFYQERLAMHNMTYVSNVSIDVEQLPDEHKITLFRIIQECVNNIIEHSNAGNCHVELQFSNNQANNTSDNCCQLHIRDDGTGFPDAVLAGQYGSGLFNIHTYVTALGGTLSLANQNGGHVYVSLAN
jgi:glucose-6-phosphate-specific signal transduction histidine kinase